MADDSPTGYVNITDGFSTADEFRPGSSWSGRTLTENQRYNHEKLTGPTRYAGDSRIVYSHAHAQQTITAGEDGLVVRRTIHTGLYATGTTVGLLKSLDDSFVEVDRVRAWVGGFRRVASEIYYSNTQDTGDETVLWKIKSQDAADSAAAVTGATSLTETVGTHHASATWHTIDETGGAEQRLEIAGPTSATTPGDTASWREFTLMAKHDGTNGADLTLRGWHIFEILTTDF